ncbi:vomeronasal type-1 receptor 4-like [Talpa occidentalis]|uniref:vomeronasal type-1 receptor 4-like n=1 Tax=Talpa occidentalis TaxID=50954 RepID=UPI00188E2558|nr:vomeronasal type-1 receptor 4-like [Talpa occidentalis]
MSSSDIFLGAIFTFQTFLGFTGNSLLFSSYMCIFLSLPHKRRPIDVILAHLTLANALTLLLRGVPSAMASFGIWLELGDAGCQAVLYLQRVSRGISLCATSLQSTFQAVTLTPSGWAWLRTKISIVIQPSLLLFWVLNMVIYTQVIVSVTSRNATRATVGYSSRYCSSDDFNYQLSTASLSIMIIRDSVLLSLMMCSSIYMVVVLHRHHKAARHVLSSARHARYSPAHRAMHLILMLVSCFAFFYWINTFLTVYLVFTNENKEQLENFSNFISSCYPTICPFLLIKNENRISRLNFIKTRIGIVPA